MKVVTAAVIRQGGCFLLARRAPGQKLPGMWEFPGGKLEKGESLQSCLERELFEELGVRAVAGKVLTESQYKYEHGEFVLKALEVQLIEDRFVLAVHDRVQWVRPADLEAFNLAPADVPIARYLREATDVV